MKQARPHNRKPEPAPDGGPQRRGRSLGRGQAARDSNLRASPPHGANEGRSRQREATIRIDVVAVIRGRATVIRQLTVESLTAERDTLRLALDLSRARIDAERVPATRTA